MFDRLIDVLLQFVDLFKFWTVLDEWERGIVLTFGRPRRKRYLLGPGLHFILPFNMEEVVVKSMALSSNRFWPQRLTTSEGDTVHGQAMCLWRVKDVEKLVLEIDDDEKVMYDSVYGTIADVIRQSTWADMQTPGWHHELYKKARHVARQVGIDLTKLSLTDLVRGDFNLVLLGSND